MSHKYLVSFLCSTSKYFFSRFAEKGKNIYFDGKKSVLEDLLVLIYILMRTELG